MNLAAVLFAVAGAVDWQNPRAVVEAALADNPTVQRLEAEATAARERIEPAGAQPNPMVMGGVQDLEVDLGRDEMMTMYMVGASQTFTRGSKRTASRRAAAREADSARLQVATARAEVERNALFAYYDVASADEQIAAVEQVRALIEAITEAARVRYEIGSTIQAEVLRAQLEKSNVEHQLASLHGARHVAAARLLSLLGLPPGAEVPQLKLPRASAKEDVEGGLVPPDDHPALAAVRAAIAASEQRIELGRLQKKPDFSVEASYGMRPTQTDMFSVTASVELPFRRKTLIEPKIREAVALRESAERRLEEVRRGLVEELAVANAFHEEMNHQFRLHEEVLVPQARMALDSTLAAYQTGRTGFDSILAAETTYLRLQLQYFDFLARHLKAIIAFEALHRGARTSGLGGAGVPLPTAPAGGTVAGSSSMTSM